MLHRGARPRLEAPDGATPVAANASYGVFRLSAPGWRWLIPREPRSVAAATPPSAVIGRNVAGLVLGGSRRLVARPPPESSGRMGTFRRSNGAHIGTRRSNGPLRAKKISTALAGVGRSTHGTKSIGPRSPPQLGSSSPVKLGGGRAARSTVRGLAGGQPPPFRRREAEDPARRCCRNRHRGLPTEAAHHGGECAPASPLTVLRAAYYAPSPSQQELANAFHEHLDGQRREHHPHQALDGQ